MKLDIRTKWVALSDADKCQYNGYMDYVGKEGDRMKREDIQDVKDKKFVSDFKKEKLRKSNLLKSK